MADSSSADPVPNKVARMSSPEELPGSSSSSGYENNEPTLPLGQTSADPTPSACPPKPDSETLYQNYLKTLKGRMTDLKLGDTQTQELVKKFEDIYLRVKTKNPKFLDKNQFSKLMNVFTKEVVDMATEADLVRHHNDLIIELNRYAIIPNKKGVSKVKDKEKKIKALTVTIKKLQKQIYTAENEELDLEALDKESCFTDLPKLYRKVEEVWMKREELLKQSTYSGRKMFKKYKCDSTPYPEINKCVENLFNSYLKKIKNKTTKGYVDESFTFIDVRKAVLEVIKDKELTVPNCEPLIEDIYKNLLKEKRERRQMDSEEVFETLEALEDLKPQTFVESDPLLELELAKNKKSFEQRMNNLFDRYANEDRKKNGESMLKDGISEWDSTTLEDNNEEFESLDVKDGDLEPDECGDEEESTEEVELPATDIPDFSTTEPAAPTPPRGCPTPPIACPTPPRPPPTPPKACPTPPRPAPTPPKACPTPPKPPPTPTKACPTPPRPPASPPRACPSPIKAEPSPPIVCPSPPMTPLTPPKVSPTITAKEIEVIIINGNDSYDSYDSSSDEIIILN